MSGRSDGGLSHLEDDVLASIDLPIVVVDSERRICRLSPKALSLLSLTEAAIGQLMSGLETPLSLRDLDFMLRKVIDTSEGMDTEVHAEDGETVYRLQIRRMGGGAVLTLSLIHI